MWASRRGQFGKVLGQVAIIIVSLFVVLLGVGSMAAGIAIGDDASPSSASVWRTR